MIVHGDEVRGDRENDAVAVLAPSLPVPKPTPTSPPPPIPAPAQALTNSRWPVLFGLDPRFSNPRLSTSDLDLDADADAAPPCSTLTPIGPARLNRTSHLIKIAAMVAF